MGWSAGGRRAATIPEGLHRAAEEVGGSGPGGGFGVLETVGGLGGHRRHGGGRRGVTGRGVADRCKIVSDSFFEAVPGGADACLLKSIIHDWDDPAAIEILRKCRVTIAEIGKLLLVEFVIEPGNEPDRAKFSDLNMLVMLGGRERTAEDFEKLYTKAGFRLTDIIRTGSAFDIIEGVPV